MLKRNTFALLLLFAGLIGCSESKEEEPTPTEHPVTAKLQGLWERTDSGWQYYDATGTAHNGLPWRYSSITSYGFTTPGTVRLTYSDGSGHSVAYELTDTSGKTYLMLPDGFGAGTKSDYLIQSTAADKIVLEATYKDVEYTDTDAQQRAQASRAVNTVTLQKK